MLAYAMRWPNDEVLLFGVIPMKVKWLVFAFVLLNLLSGIVELSTGTQRGTAYFAHLGGLIFGFLYLRTPSAESLDRLRQRISPAPDVPDDETPRAIPRSMPRGRGRERESEVDEIVARSKAIAAKRPVVAAPVRAPSTQERQLETLNLLLDKISQNGMDSLTTEERTLLQEVSVKLRKS
jgi:hypothetical protein